MKLSNIVEAKKEETVNGTYVAVRYSRETKKKLKEMCTKLKVPNRLPSEKIHTTLIYSRKELPEFKALGDFDKPLIVKPSKFEIFKSYDDKNCLVLLLDSKKLCDRHSEIMDEHKATYDFDEYKCHITLSYDCGDFDITKHDPSDHIKELEVVEEYSEPLVIGWQDKDDK